MKTCTRCKKEFENLFFNDKFSVNCSSHKYSLELCGDCTVKLLKQALDATDGTHYDLMIKTSGKVIP